MWQFTAALEKESRDIYNKIKISYNYAYVALQRFLY